MQLVRVEDEDQLWKLARLLEQKDTSALFVVELIKSVLRFKYTGWEFYTLVDGTECQTEDKDGDNLLQQYGVLCADRTSKMCKYTVYTNHNPDAMVTELKKKVSCCATNVFFAIPLHLTASLRTMFRDGTMNESPCLTYVLRDFRKLPETPDLDDGNEFAVRKIGEEYASVINSNWKHSRSDSEDSIREELQLGFGYGVFVSKKIVSWVILRRFGGMGILYTLPEFRGRGYASFVVSALSRDMSAFNMTVFVQIEMENDVSVKFFEKLGFEKGPDSAFIVPVSLTATTCCI